ncbi:hypothetical protein [Flavobacterium gelatinilyticum]|uniref:hypothetical protein n=1 Tax=Flavobacterium gelatinilyticum TaxID=3003260 RepID=UPI0024811970|nr:hypothetical protein [Flavobacterium gelatinilyticum]
MKILTLRIAIIAFLISLLSYSCAEHCDDEDYRREEREASLYHADSLRVSKDLD